LNKAIFFDRDGTLNIDPGYLGDPDKVELYPNVPEVIFKLKNKLGFKIFVVSNQSGITRGLITKEQVDAVNDKINCLLKEKNTSIDDFFYCPYHPDFDDIDKCKCRKPSPELVLFAAKKYDINLNKSFFIGDKEVDIECGNNAGLKTVLINHNTNERFELKNISKTPTFVAYDFNEIYNFIVTECNGGNF